MQFTLATIAAIMAAGASALPSVSPRQTTFTEIATFSASGCQGANRIGTTNLIDVNSCQNLPSGVVSSKVDLDLPAGCKLTFFTGPGCSSQQIVQVPKDAVPHQCFEMGAGKQVGSVIASGTCNSF